MNCQSNVYKYVRGTTQITVDHWGGLDTVQPDIVGLYH